MTAQYIESILNNFDWNSLSEKELSDIHALLTICEAKVHKIIYTKKYAKTHIPKK